MSSEHINDYLWDRSGNPDPLVAELEAQLAPLRYAPQRARTNPPLTIQAKTPRRTLLAAAMVLLAITGAWIAAVLSNGQQGRTTTYWHVAALSGAPRVGSEAIRSNGRVHPGEWIQTDSQSQARLQVAEIGNVTIDPDSRLRLVATSDRQHRLELARGGIEAFITAPPRLFLVDTPAATAVDLGCKYRLEVDELGSGLLAVTLGWVSLEREGSVSIVPFGAECEIHQTFGPGTPHYADVSSAFRDALYAFDFENGGEAALRAVLTESRPRDALTLWHLLSRVKDELRTHVYAKLVADHPLPSGINRESILQGDARALDAWAQSMYWSPPRSAMAPR